MSTRTCPLAPLGLAAGRFHVDDLVARARALTEQLNATLTELSGLGVDCLGVRDPRRFHPGDLITSDRVSLTLNFKVKE